MNILQLEHVLRAAGEISGCRNIAVIGSQAILASFPDAPGHLVVSMEADVYPLDEPEKAEVIDGAIGELSDFHKTFGYYAHGVGPETATLPKNWQARVVHLESPNTSTTVGWCLSPEDIVISKLAAGREKDIEYVRILLRLGYVDEANVIALLGETEQSLSTRIHARLVQAKVR